MSNITHLKELESESIYVLREVAAQFERPVILFSGGKDSIVIVHFAYKAFYPAKIPFLLLHIDTGHNFPETIAYRDALVWKFGADLIVGSVQESIDKGRVKEETGYYASRNKLQTTKESLGIVRSINYRQNINTLEKEPGVAEIKMNDIAVITIHTAQPLAFDDYRLNRITGSVSFIDPDTNETVGAGMIKTETIWNKHNSYVI